MKQNNFSLKNLGADLPASIVVFLVALPLCLGVALASNAPLFSGLIAGMVGGIAVGLLSGSQLSVSGPAAGLTAIVAAAILKLPSFEAFLFSVVICGALQLLLGFLKAGVIGDYIPNSVIKGMLAAIGLILILKQLPHLIGYDANPEGEVAFVQANNENTFSAVANALNYITPVAVLIGLAGLTFQFIWEKIVAKKKGFVKLIPAPLVVVLIGIGINEIFRHQGIAYAVDPKHMVNIPVAQTSREFFSFFTAPDFGVWMNKDIWITGVTLALVASLESLLSIEAVDDLDPYQRVTDKDRELKAQGIGNMLSGLIGGLPVTSVIVRSSANVNAGAKSKMSTVFHGLLLLVSIAFIPALLNLIPKAALAAVLIFTGYKLAKPSLFKLYYKKGWDQFFPFVITILAILLTDLLIGVVIGIGVGIFFVVRSNFKTSVFVVNDQHHYLFRLRKDVSFLNKPIIKNKLEEVPENASVLIDASRADFIDKDVVEVIEHFLVHAPLKNIHVEVKYSGNKAQGFNKTLLDEQNAKSHNGLKRESILETTEAATFSPR
ncbi:SulP family inorganic anion transporter [Flavisolibacter ginsenosidimutans]|uniref:SulP family inorganic anion transporter n=1 Tax=Flavisolibacter ginsenosidimutans TaxID=661481 RepID=A0A5B8UJQ8_9BACT|nr:SulP family inorganic anion transporter [Flavisolibacter ginsenosidimutans]QEC56927.1 SulP family inorganic anion transporter [Flavisolibacter ginsenosidimutans]